LRFDKLSAQCVPEPDEGHETEQDQTEQDQELNTIMCSELVEGHKGRKPQASDTSAVPHHQIVGDAGKEKKC